MNKFVMTLVVCISLVSMVLTAGAQDRFDRSGVIRASELDIGGFGNVLAGVDIDGDGNMEIYGVSNDWHDVAGKDWVPRIHKYEKDADGKWTEVWGTRLAFDFQNTWPGLAYGDMDNDGKGEVVWGPVNNTNPNNPNPSRIVVFETPGDGSDNMGVDNGDGTWKPNAEWSIVTADAANLRPFRWFINDIDNDGTDEIVTAARVGDGIQVYSTDDVPDDASGSETWTLEFSGVDGTHYDLAIIGSTIYGIRSNGNVTPVTWDAVGDSFAVGETQLGIVGAGSWKSATTVDVDSDGSDEIIVASWNSGTRNVYLLQQDADTLTSTIIQEVPAGSNRLYGGAAGDLDADGNLDFVFGTRQATPNGLIHRLEYQGGAIDDPANWELSDMDWGVSAATQYDVITTADLDGDGEDEVIYSGTPRGLGADDPPQPIVILDRIPGNQPVIRQIVDTPNDNGRQIHVGWQAAADDVPGGGSETITEYTVWRRVEAGMAPSPKANQIHLAGGLYEQVGTTKAVQRANYVLTVPTLYDKVDGADGPFLSAFVVAAHTADPLTHWHSFLKAGYSIDNLIPTAPANLAAAEDAGEVVLSWDESVDSDFNYFAVVRGSEAGFSPEGAEEVGTTTGTEFIDSAVAEGETWYYRVVAFDFSKNQGIFSDEVDITLLVTSVSDADGALPKAFALEQNYPNPFNPQTSIRFDMPKNAQVSIKIYNMMGQEVRTLVNEFKAAGTHEAVWDGRDNSGVKASSGLYIYSLRAGEFTANRRMTLVK